MLIDEILTPGTAKSVVIGSGVAFVAADTAGLQVVSYLPNDDQGQAPTVAFNIPAIDTELATPEVEVEVEVEEGSHISIFATISDDVQVRNGNFLVDGEVIRNDVSFPFDFTLMVSFLADGSDTVTIEVRANDTGGNTGTSGPLVLNIVPGL